MKKEIFSLILATAVSFCSAQDLSQLIREAESDLEKNHWERAYNKFEDIFEKYTDDLTFHQRARIYNYLGSLDLLLLEPQEAERNLSFSLLYHEEAGIPSEKDYADALLNIGMLYLEQVEFDLSREHIQRALNILEKRPEYALDFIIAKTKLARLYEEAGSYTLALSIYNESYDKMLAGGNDLSADFAEVCSHKGRILMLTGDPSEGEKFINLSATIYESLGKSYNVRRAESMEDLAVFYEQMGRYDEAEAMLLEILALKRSIPDEADILIIETLNDLGIMYQQLGRIGDAEEMFNEVILECEENVGTSHPFYATAKNNLGTIALSKGNFEVARDMFEAALVTYKEKFGSVHPYYANALNNLARVERKLGNIEGAEKHYKEVLDIDRRVAGADHPNYATTLLNIGVLYSSSGREDQAEEYYSEALKIREEALGLNHPSYGSALEYMGMHYLATNQLLKAEEQFRKSIDIKIEQIKSLFPIMTEPQRERFYSIIKEHAERYQSIAVKLLDTNPEFVKQIFDVQVKTKTVLFNTLDRVHEVVADSEDEMLQSHYNQWLSDKRLLASYYQIGIRELEQQHINLDLVEADMQRQEELLGSRIEEFEEALPHDKIDWRLTLKAVRPNEAIVEMIRIKDYEVLSGFQGTLFNFKSSTKYLAIIFKSGSSEPDYVLLGDDFTTDDQHMAAYTNYLETGVGGEVVYNKYWKEVANKVAKTPTIRMVPEGIYHTLNPNALQVKPGQYVIDNNYVAVLTSVYDVMRSEAEVFNKKSYFFGNPSFAGSTSADPLGLSALEDSSEEIDHVSQLLPESEWKVSTYLGSDANELRIRSAYNPTLMHLSTPGYFGTRDQFHEVKSLAGDGLLRAGLFLTGAAETYEMFQNGIKSIQENDGVLSTYEIMNLNLHRTRLVVFSSLDVKIGDMESGIAFYGLLHGTMVAGARNVIASTSLVPSSARRELFDLFYDKFTSTDSVLESFKYAQRELRKKYNDPKVWGSFIIAGSGI